MTDVREPSVERLIAHLEAEYGIDVSGSAELDVGVLRVDRRDGPSWVARPFADRTVSEVETEAAILRALTDAGFPAERCAADEPVSEHEGNPVLVTELVEGERSDGRGRTYAFLGALLGRLHTHAGASAPHGGAWHHLSPRGGPREEIGAAIELLEDSEHLVRPEQHERYDRILDALEELDDGSGLPTALVHPDFVPVNSITTPDDRRVIVDWTGVGRGPRLWSLAFVLWAGGARDLRLVDVALSRYLRHIALTDEELDRLPTVMAARPLTIDVWSFGHGRLELAEVARRLSANQRIAAAVTDRVREAVAAARDGDDRDDVAQDGDSQAQKPGKTRRS